jgi:hypothetical protein
MPSFTNHDFWLLPAEYRACPRARTFSYNAVGPISALGFKSTTLAQLMARYATMDPTLISSTSNNRKALPLVAPPAAKKKRTTKKMPIEVISLLSRTQDHSPYDTFHLLQFQIRTQQPSVASESANAPPAGMTFTASFKGHHLHWHLPFIWHLQKK